MWCKFLKSECLLIRVMRRYLLFLSEEAREQAFCHRKHDFQGSTDITFFFIFLPPTTDSLLFFGSTACSTILFSFLLFQRVAFPYTKMVSIIFFSSNMTNGSEGLFFQKHRKATKQRPSGSKYISPAPSKYRSYVWPKAGIGCPLIDYVMF